MKKRKIIYVVTAIVLCLAAVTLWYLNSKSVKPEFRLDTETAGRKDISTYITATGTIEPVTEVEVGTQVSGIIDKIYVDYNSVVKEGELIAEMDKVTLMSDLQSAKATYAGAESEYNYQKKLYERSRNLHEKELISDTEYEEAVYNYQRALSSYEQSKASLAKAERNLSYATILSPIDGIVTSKDVEEGQTVASGFETPTLFTIAADLTKMQVVADVDEADIADVREGNKVLFTVDAYPNDTFEGVVRQVRLGSTNSSSSASTGTTTETVVTYEVVITADNPDLKLKPRLTANVTIYTVNHENVLAVPAKALRLNPEVMLSKEYKIIGTDSKHRVWTIKDKTLKAIPVETGLSDGTYTEITSGLEEGTEIITNLIMDNPDINMGNSPDEGQNPFMPGRPGQKKNK